VAARLGQRHLFPEFVQVRGYNRPSQGLRPLWRVEPDLERDRDSRQHATQHNDPERGHCLRQPARPDLIPQNHGPRPQSGGH
jgi:hypothetical protein